MAGTIYKMVKKILICGTRKRGYENIVREVLNNENPSKVEIIEGCCPNSADEYAEKWAKDNNVKINHFPSMSGSYLKRNIEMVEVADRVIAFWDNFSYGTCHTIATAIRLNKPVLIIKI